MKHMAILILAAGTSSRLGEPKQLLEYQGKSLLWHACTKALALSDDVYVVLGAKATEAKKSIESLSVKTLHNEAYEKGLSSSIHTGINALNDYEQVLIMLCDQPFLPTFHLQQLISQSNTDKIVCSFYQNDVAVPALFPKKYYQALLQLQGDKGAKQVIKNSSYIMITLDEHLALDIDTKEDVKNLV